jgi:general secretion pathway protein H
MNAMQRSGLGLTGMVVVAALLATAPPYLGKALVRLRAESAADDIAQALAEARSLAISLNREVQVTFDERDSTWQLDGSPAKLPAGVVIAAPRRDHDGQSAITFYPDGSSTGGQVVVSARHRAWMVGVDLRTGTVRRRHAGV